MATLRPQVFNFFTKNHLFRHIPRNILPSRNSSYEGSPFLVDVDVTTKYEKTQIPKEWKCVERIIPPVLVPQPQKLSEYPSGWKPPGDDFTDTPYFVARSRNHMMPVYLDISQRGSKRQTIVKNIQGDIWQFEKDLRPFLEDLIKPRHLRLQVNEFARKICINGDHVNAIKYWLGEKNF